MMKYISKLVCLLGLSVFVGISVLYITNMVNGNQIELPSQSDLHRPILQSLFLGDKGQPSIKIIDDKLSIFNGLIMGEGNSASLGASFVTIGGGSSNSLGEVEKSGIGGGNNNSINTNFSVIGGGSGNTTSGNSSQGVAIAGGMNNQAGNGGAILGGEGNVVDGTGVILGGQNNTLQGNGIALGSNSNGGDGSFSWNSPYSQDNSAVIVASGGILVGTYEPITGVNLVVDGTMKISGDNEQEIAGEIRMMSGCFYGYDGNVWHVINRSSGVGCPRVACDFGSTLLYPGQTGQAYSSFYSVDCSEELVDVTCNEDGTLGSDGDYYSYCYNLSNYGVKKAKCGNASGGSYRNLSSTSSNLCKGSTVQDWIENDTEFLWTCNIGDSTVECSAKKSFVSHHDGGLITICNPNNDAECLTLMDRNLGATTNDITNIGSYGNLYQWGNNYGFPSTGNGKAIDVKAIWDDSYNKKGYDDDAFIISSENYWADGMPHRDIWGGSGDIASNGYGYPMNNPDDRRGPCESGYHVPSIGEWGKVVERWYARYGGNIGFQGTSPFVYFTDTQARNQFQNDFLIPYAGHRDFSNGNKEGEGDIANLWSSSINDGNYATLLGVFKGGGNVVSTQPYKPISHGASVRCFKNEVNEAKCGVANCNVYASLLSNSSDLCKGESSTVQNWTSSDTGYSWVCSNGISKVNCSAKKSFVSYDDGLITICNPDNDTECLTLMDKNLGAKSVGTGNGSYGNYYQWGNNYGFSSTGGVSSSSIKVDASGYGPNNYYSGSTYILAPETPYDWSSVPNGNLWGGITNTYQAMKGPCPDGYHVPTSGEWSKLISWWSGSMYNNSCSTMGNQFRDTFLIPFAGYRNFNSTNINCQGVDAYYRSSNANNGSNEDTAYRMYFSSSYGHTKNPNRRTYAFQLRCFKNPENSFADLEMYLLTNEGNARYYAMMDRNLGATAYMDQPGKTTGDRYGNYYQWGNNYGFPNYGTITNTSNEKVDVSLYGPGNYYSSDTFIMGGDGKGWLREQNENLWGGNGSEIDRQGPCPQGYHIPKKDEFENLVQIWKESANYPLDYMGASRSSDTLMPFAGTRGALSLRAQGYWGFYWLSSSELDYYASSVHFYTLINSGSTNSINNALYSVRCFKNSSTPSITLHPNGGTGALIIVHDGKITKLGTPSKGTTPFLGWYWDSGYTSKVKTGDIVSASAHLYAKWNEQCGTYNPSDFKDLDIYFLTDEGTTGHYTLMDRNLGATQVYTGVANVCTYGYHYQWGNNYGFPDNETLKQSNKKVDVSLYGPGNYYSSDIFISVLGESWMSGRNENLWGGNGSEIDRKGPCPVGYHIPKKDEFRDLVSNWGKSISPTSYTGRQRSLDALMPLAGIREDIYSVGSQGYYGWYWTASTKPDHYAYRVMFSPNEIHVNNYSADYVAESVRCFKNSQSPSITLHPNGGTGALIIVHDGKITKLGTPSKGTTSFLGWYWDSTYYSKAKKGDTVPASAHLYARWKLQCETYNPSDFKDLDMYFLTSDGATGHYTLMDRNLGATQVYTGVNNECTYGYYYKWGNNNGFLVGQHAFAGASYGSQNDWGQGPCPEGYHVPTSGEYGNILDNWKNSTIYTGAGIFQWMLDSRMPLAGSIDYSYYTVLMDGGERAHYWTSISPYPSTAYAAYINSEINPNILKVSSGIYKPNGMSVRCFKNSLNSLITLHPNGGTGALIIVYDGKITKLGTPHKGNQTFGGWYWDSGYTSKAKTGDTVPASAHLYAKRGDSVPLQCGTYNPSNFKDLDMYFLTDEGITGHYTLMDRNLGATQVYTGVHNVCTYGYYYQWGNNYGFPNQGLVNTSTVKVSSSGYGPDKPYSSDTFILGSDGWSNDYNNNLRGGNGSEIDRKGPCPVGYHIPTRDEFVDIVNNYWEKSADYVPNKKGRQRALDSLMPFAGVRYYADSLVYNWGSNADYWSASGRPDTPYSYFFYFSSGSRNPQVNDSRSYGLSLRCFKNSSTPSMTLHPNGGTGALIIVHDGKITKLGIPSNGGATFGGWYSDAGYISLVHVGDTAPAHLYAKWVGITPTSSAKCGSANEGSYVNLSDTSINLCEEGTVKNRTLSDMEFSWVCDDGDTKVNCSATRLYEVQLLGDDKDMNDFVYGIIRIGDDYIMDRNLGATAVWDGITKRGGKGKDYNYDYDGYFYEWGNNYGFSNDGKCSLKGLSNVDMIEHVCKSDKEGQILPSSCVYGEFICPINGPWFDVNGKEISYMWGMRGGRDNDNGSGPCPEGWHIPTLSEVENVVSQLKEDQILLYGGGFHSAYGGDMLGKTLSDGSLQYYTGDEKVLSWFWMAGEAKLDKTHEYNKYFAPYFEIKCELDKEGVCHDVKYSHAQAHTEIGLPVRCFRNRN